MHSAPVYQSKAALVFALGIALSFNSGQLFADMISSEGMAAWEVCALCHGANGVSATARFPKLAAQKPSYLETQISNFKAGLRHNDGGQMEAIITELAEQNINDVVQHFATQAMPNPVALPARDKALCERGAELYFHGRDNTPACATCHSDKTSPAPWLDAQHADYIAKQLGDFKEQERSTKLAPMADIAASLKEPDIEALATFLAAVSLRNSTTNAQPSLIASLCEVAP